MAWTVEFTATACKQLSKIDKKWQNAILDYLAERVLPGQNPRRYGKLLTGDRKGLWRYRVGDYRIICSLEGEKAVVLVVTIGHRKQVYR